MKLQPFAFHFRAIDFGRRDGDGMAALPQADSYRDVRMQIAERPECRE
jgi:hypothetical protein